MNDKGHFYLSLVKSAVRGVACICGMVMPAPEGVVLLAAGLLLAEMFGVFEELADTR